MPSSPSIILGRLQRASRLWQLRQLLALTLVALLAFAVPLLVAGLFDLAWQQRESVAAIVLMLATATGLSAAVVGLLTRLRPNWPTPRRVALAVEESCPEYMDSLVCAVELLATPSPRLNALNQALLANVSRQVDAAQIDRAVRQRTLRPWQLALLALAAIAALYAAAAMPLAAKARLGLHDLLAAGTTGLEVAPGDVEVARGDDVKIGVRIRRGPGEARLILRDERGEHTYEMYEEQDGLRTHTQYGVTGNFTYRIETPTLRSRRYTVAVYERPAIEQLIIRIDPPAYTRIGASQTDRLADLTAPFNSTITFDVTGNLEMDAVLLPEDGPPIRFAPAGERRLTASFKLTERLLYRLQLHDRQGRSTTLPGSYLIDCVSDLPPALRIEAPEETATADREDEVTFAIGAMDDYGVASVTLHYSIAGAPFVETVIHPAGGPALGEVVADHKLALKGQVEYGDVVYYFASATDQCEPQANVGRTEVRFLEIRPGQDQPDSGGGEGGGMPGESLKLSVKDLILKQKLLIQQTFRHDQEESAASQLEMRQRLSIEAEHLYVDADKRFTDLQRRATDIGSLLRRPRPELPTELVPILRTEQTPLAQLNMLPPLETALPAPSPLPPGDLTRRPAAIANEARGFETTTVGRLFQEAIGAMDQARTILASNTGESGSVTESLPFQQRSLSRLIAVEIELAKNQQQSTGQGQGEQQQESQPKQDEFAEKDAEKERQKQIEGVKEKLEALRELVQRQQALNLGMAQNERDGKFGDAARMGTIRQQQEILADTWDVRNDLTQMPDARDAATELSKATQHMTGTRQAVQLNQADRAMKEGQLAAQFLARSQELLEKLLDDLSGNDVRLAERQLRDLREKQRALREETERAAAGQTARPAEALGQEQQQLREQFEQLMSQMGQTAQQLEEQNPQAARALGEAMQAAREDNIDGRMARAQNALRYQRPERAATYQKEVESALDRLADELSGAAEAAGRPGKEELAKMQREALENLERMQRLAEEQAGPDAKREQGERMKRSAEQMARALGDPRLDELAEGFREVGESPGEFSHEDVRRAMELTRDIAQLLRLKMLEQDFAQRVEFARLAGRLPPEEYRRLVNEYFKKLSEEN